MGCAVPTANRARSSLILSCICFLMLSLSCWPVPRCWQDVWEIQIPLLGTPSAREQLSQGMLQAQELQLCPQVSPVTRGWPSGAGTRQRGLKDKAETRVGCTSRCSVPSPRCHLAGQGMDTLCHFPARPCCSPGPSGCRSRRREGDGAGARAGHVCSDSCDGLCTTHTSHSREGSEAGLDSDGKTSRESCKGRVPGSCSRQGTAPCPGRGGGSSQRWQPCPRAGTRLSLGLSPGHSQLFACPVLTFLTPLECQTEGLSPRRVQQVQEGMPGPCQAVGAWCRSAAVQGLPPIPAMGFPLGAAPSHSPTLTSCGAGGGPRAGKASETPAGGWRGDRGGSGSP